jgi:hypothetical protein
LLRPHLDLAASVLVMRSITIRDVAERAGVSVGTVSNALNQPEIVATETRQQILRAVDEIGYIRNSPARQLRGLGAPPSAWSSWTSTTRSSPMSPGASTRWPAWSTIW